MVTLLWEQNVGKYLQRGKLVCALNVNIGMREFWIAGLKWIYLLEIDNA